MKIIPKVVVAGVLLAPPMVFAAGDCHVVEHADHFEAVCVGDATQAPQRAESPSITVQPALKPPVSAETKSPPPAPPDAVKALIDYRQRQSQRSLRDAAKASRMKFIQGGGSNQSEGSAARLDTALKP